MAFVNCQAESKHWGWEATPLQDTEDSSRIWMCICLQGGMNARDFRSNPKFNVSGPRLVLIQGHCVLVSINTEINTTLQSAPFINGVTHLMRALLTPINLPCRSGQSRNFRQLPAWIYSTSALGKYSHSGSTFSLQEGGKSKASRLRISAKHTQVLKTILLAFSGYCSSLILFFLVSGSQTSIDGFLLKPDHKIFSKWAKTLIKTVKGKVWVREELNEMWGIFHCSVSLILYPRLTHKEENILPWWQHVI